MREWYLFAIFVFALIYILILLYSKHISRKYPDISEYKQREERLFKLYQNIEDLMDSFEEYVEEVRESLLKDIEEKRKEIKEELNNQKTLVPFTENLPAKVDKKAKENKPDNNNKPRSMTDKISMINQLLEEGLPVEDIAKKLDMGKGEIKLILQLNNKKTKV